MGFRAEWYDGNGTRQSETLTSAHDADVFLKAVTENGKEWPKGWVRGKGIPKAIVPASPTVLDIVDARIETAKSTLDNPRTAADYQRMRDRYLHDEEGQPYPLAEQSFDLVTPDDVAGWIATLSRRLAESPPRRHPDSPPQPLSNKTIKNVHSLVSGAFKVKVARREIPTNPALGLSPKVSRAGKGRALTAEQAKALISFIEPQHQPIIELLVRTGMRWSEVSALYCEDFDPKAKVLKVSRAWKEQARRGHFELLDTKETASERPIELDPESLAILKAATKGKANADWIFQTARGGPLRHNNFYARAFRPAALRLKSEKIASFAPTVHDLRHTHATLCLQQGLNIHELSRRLGHKSPAFTLERYISVMPSSGAAAKAIHKALR